VSQSGGSPLADEFSLHLGQGAHDAQEEPSRGGRGVDGLVEAMESDLVDLKDVFHKKEEITGATGQPVELRDHHGLDIACLTGHNKALEASPLEILTA
jgi:hypothetical protein